MGRKRNPYLPLYTRDIMSSPRCRALSCQATGVYLWLLCRLNEPPTPGAFRLSDWEAHPTWKRSLTQQCLAEPDKQRRLQYFARYRAKNDFPWDKKEVLDGLQELYRMGIVAVEGDMLVQPRMYKDNGFELPDLDQDGAPEDTILDDAASGSMAIKEGDELSDDKGAKISTEKGTQKRTEKVQRKAPVSRAGASRAEIEIENNNNDIVVEDSKKRKTQKFTPPTLEEVQAFCREKAFTFDPIMFWNHYEANGWMQGKGKPIKSWQACCNTWQRREGEFGGARGASTQGRGQSVTPLTAPKAGDPVPTTKPAKGKYKKW
jgi:hypothetical protein